MTPRRLVLALAAFALMLPLSGCGCRRQCCNSSSNSFAPPPCGSAVAVPAGYVPSVRP